MIAPGRPDLEDFLQTTENPAFSPTFCCPIMVKTQAAIVSEVPLCNINSSQTYICSFLKIIRRWRRRCLFTRRWHLSKCCWLDAWFWHQPPRQLSLTCLDFYFLEQIQFPKGSVTWDIALLVGGQLEKTSVFSYWHSSNTILTVFVLCGGY